ncbi:low temperature requirement protein A [Microbacterium sp. SORGH_AS_0888]|uniref:low temperature requirement protein A n=1 Tax=Microbacterium sp. SORGH_AS_0888 TaxID=3041791 RepID=UPI0027828868|nr:low temperature requirement protein A [Microbacterium sp. SORGH_AS_0888]MDQ1129005.1 low temperature requirement protein LtrA [Microbacterium sp. SORGH_AS_0888]
MTSSLGILGLRRVRARDNSARGRVATPLELLFDLVFVVAVSQASVNLHHLLAEGHIGDGVLSYLMVFFAIWWAWVNFTWFASAFDTDDWAYRIVTIVQMGGVLVLAAGIHDAMVSQDFFWVTWGYVIMRLAMVAQWVRAAVSDPGYRATAWTFAVGITIVQVLWVARIYLLDARWQLITFFVLMVAEIAVPVIAESRRATPWHPHHIAERYGLFTLILLGESLLASATAIFEAVGEGEHVGELVWLAVSGLVVAAGMWWIYFAREPAERLTSSRAGFFFGYGHYLVFAAAGAVSAGVEVEVDHILGTAHLDAEAAGLALTIPVAVFLVFTWLLVLRGSLSVPASVAVLGGAVLILFAGMLPVAEYAVAAVLLVLVVAAVEADAVVRRRRNGFEHAI